MITRLMSVDGTSPEKSRIKEIAAALRGGCIAGIPTETVFGLACNKDAQHAVKRLYAIKQRPADKFLVVQIADIKKLVDYKACITEKSEYLLRRFWPGPLTVVLNTKYGSMGFRIPNNKTALAVIKEADFPVAVTSANLSGHKALLCAEDVKKVFNGKIDIVVDDKTKLTGIASTVIDCTKAPFKILRRGAAAAEIEKLI